MIENWAEKFANMFGIMTVKMGKEKFNAAVQLANQGKFQNAVSLFREIVDSSGNVDAQLKIAVIQHLYLQNFKQAVIEYQKVLKMNPRPEIEKYVKFQIQELLSGRGDDIIVPDTLKW